MRRASRPSNKAPQLEFQKNCQPDLGRLRFKEIKESCLNITQISVNKYGYGLDLILKDSFNLIFGKMDVYFAFVGRWVPGFYTVLV